MNLKHYKSLIASLSPLELALSQLEGFAYLYRDQPDNIPLRWGAIIFARLLENGMPSRIVSKPSLRSVLRNEPRNLDWDDLEWPRSAMLFILPSGVFLAPDGGSLRFITVARNDAYVPFQIPGSPVQAVVEQQKPNHTEQKSLEPAFPLCKTQFCGMTLPMNSKVIPSQSAPKTLGENNDVEIAKSRLVAMGRSLGTSVRQLKKAIGDRLFSKIEGINKLPSKRELADLIKSVKGRKKIPLSKASTLISTFVEERRCYRHAKHSLGLPSSHARRLGDKPLGKVRGTRTAVWRVAIAGRLSSFKHKNRASLIAQNYRQTHSSWVGGERTIEVRYSEAPYAEGITETVWHEKKVRSGTNSTLIVAFSQTWYTDVFKKGISVIAGMVTTHATEIEPGVFRASWVEQGRGFSLRKVSGFIVVAGHDAVHGPTESAAKQTARRRNPEYQAEQSRQAAERAKRVEAKIGPIRAMLERGDIGSFGDITVTFADSIRAGNCETGTTHWRNKHFPGRESATIREVLAVADEKPLVVAACLRANRRTRAIRRMKSI